MKKAMVLFVSLGLLAAATSCQRAGISPGEMPLDEGAMTEPLLMPQEQLPPGPVPSEGQNAGPLSKQADAAKICSLAHRVLAVDPKALVAGDGTTAAALLGLLSKDAFEGDEKDGDAVDPEALARIAADVNEFAVGSIPDMQAEQADEDTAFALISFRNVDPALAQNHIDYLMKPTDGVEINSIAIDMDKWRWDVGGTAKLSDVVFFIGKPDVYKRVIDQVETCTQDMLDALCVLGEKKGGIYATMKIPPSDDKFVKMLGGSELKVGATLTVNDNEIQAYGWLVRGACSESNVLASILPMMKRELLDILIQYMRERGTDDVEEVLVDEEASSETKPGEPVKPDETLKPGTPEVEMEKPPVEPAL